MRCLNDPQHHLVAADRSRDPLPADADQRVLFAQWGRMMELEYQSTTTLIRIRDACPCKNGWEKLLANLGKTKADDEPLQLLTILDSNGFDDALWVLSLAMPDDRLARHFQAWCAEQVLHHFEAAFPRDMRVRDQIAMLRNDHATDAARDASRAAAQVAAWGAPRAAAWDAAQVAAWDAAWDAAWGAQERQLRLMLSTTTAETTA